MAETTQIDGGQRNPADATPLPPAPSTKGLSEPQLRGSHCVWCDTPLTTDTAVDLGERPYRRLDVRSSWFPRACPGCAGEKAYSALFAHAPTCEQCVDNATECATGRALNRLVKGGGR